MHSRLLTFLLFVGIVNKRAQKIDRSILKLKKEFHCIEIALGIWMFVYIADIPFAFRQSFIIQKNGQSQNGFFFIALFEFLYNLVTYLMAGDTEISVSIWSWSCHFMRDIDSDINSSNILLKWIVPNNKANNIYLSVNSQSTLSFAVW